MQRDRALGVYCRWFRDGIRLQ